MPRGTSWMSGFFPPTYPFARLSSLREPQNSLLPNFFNGFDDPFGDPFFASPFDRIVRERLFGPSLLERSSVDQVNTRRSNGPIIKELSSDDEEETERNEGGGERKGNPRKHSRVSSKQPFVQEPDDEIEFEGRRSKQMKYRNEGTRARASTSRANPNPNPNPNSYVFQSSTVTYGGPNGAYFTSSSTRRTGSDGITFEESKQADSATRRAAHRISRGIGYKGHSVTRKLNSDGRVNTMQTLHNLNEDELAGFEENWRGKANIHLPGLDNGENRRYYNQNEGRRGWALPKP